MHGLHIQRLGVAEVALQRTLDLKVVVLHQVHQLGVLHLPPQHVVTRIGVQRVFLFLHGQVVRPVVRTYIDLGRLNRTGLVVQALVAPGGERSAETLLHRIRGRHKDMSRSIGGLDLLVAQRGGIGDRLSVGHIRHGRIAVARDTLVGYAVEIRVEQLRLLLGGLTHQTGSQVPIKGIGRTATYTTP